MNPAAAPRSLARLLITGNPALPSPAGGALPGPSAGAQRLRRPRQLGGAAAGRARAAPAGGLAAARHTPSLALTSGPSRRQPLPPSGTPLPQPQAHPTTHHVPTQTPTVSPRKHPPSPHANTRRVPLYDFFKTSLPPISPPKPPVTLVVAHSQGVPAFLQAGRTYLLTPSAGSCAHQTAPTKADEGGCSSCSSPAAWDPALRLVGLGRTPTCQP